MVKEIKSHEHKHAHHDKSKLSLFKHKVAGLFKEIVEAPPMEEASSETVVEAPEQYDESGIKITAEVSEKEIIKPEPIAVEPDPEEIKNQEREEMREKIHDHIINKLNQAVSEWKQTGSIGEVLEPPVPLKDKVKAFWSKVKLKSAPISMKLKSEADAVFEKVSARLKKAEHSGEKVDADIVIKEEWSKVIERVEETSTPSDRVEIEKLYKELTGE